MRRLAPFPTLAVLPTPAEQAALAVTAGYFARAGSAAATRLLGCQNAGDAELLREQLDRGAALCCGLLDAIAEQDAWLRRLP